MTTGAPSERPAEGGQPSAYERLGIGPDASFDAVQQAKQARLAELGDDPQARARIEAAYDAVLMDRLKERQQGKVSSAALNASQREAARPVPSPAPPRPGLAALPSLPKLVRPGLTAPSFSLPQVAPAEGRSLWLPLLLHGGLLAILLLAPPTAGELLLALATGVTLVSLQRRQGRFFVALAWSVGLLTAGLLLGGLLMRVLDPSLPLGLPLAPQQVEALPALLLLLLGAVLIA